MLRECDTSVFLHIPDRPAWRRSSGAGDSFPGGHSGREPPDPIPNSEVKTLCADGSLAVGQVRVGHCQDPMRTPRRKRRGVFLCTAAIIWRQRAKTRRQRDNGITRFAVASTPCGRRFGRNVHQTTSRSSRHVDEMRVEENVFFGCARPVPPGHLLPARWAHSRGSDPCTAPGLDFPAFAFWRAYLARSRSTWPMRRPNAYAR